MISKVLTLNSKWFIRLNVGYYCRLRAYCFRIESSIMIYKDRSAYFALYFNQCLGHMFSWTFSCFFVGGRVFRVLEILSSRRGAFVFGYDGCQIMGTVEFSSISTIANPGLKTSKWRSQKPQQRISEASSFSTKIMLTICVLVPIWSTSSTFLKMTTVFHLRLWRLERLSDRKFFSS